MAASKRRIASVIVITCIWSLWASGCDAPVQPTREWTPADHGQPQALAAEDGRAAPPSAESAAAEEEDPQARAQRAVRALWVVSCAGCHGREGRGDGSSAPPGAQLPDFSRAELQASRTDEQWLTVIREGRGLMPAFEKKLRPEAITALVGYLRTFGPQPGADTQGQAPTVQPAKPGQGAPADSQGVQGTAPAP